MEIKEFKVAIAQQIKELEIQLPSLKSSAEPVKLDPSSVGRLSRMDALAAQVVNKRAYDSARSELGNLKKLLEQCDDNEFNLCQTCEEPINLKRLLTVPGSRSCIQCAKRL